MFLATDIPDNITNDEKIVRFIYSPINIDSKNKVRSNAFRPPSDSDEVSVTRFNYCDAHYCKAKAKDIQSDRRNFFGLGRLIASDILDAGATLRVTPITEEGIYHNPAHSDIIIGMMKKGEECSSEIKLIMDELAKKCVLFIDPNVEEDEWNGDTL